jgi:hypothetical protein
MYGDANTKCTVQIYIHVLNLIQRNVEYNYL